MSAKYASLRLILVLALTVCCGSASAENSQEEEGGGTPTQRSITEKETVAAGKAITVKPTEELEIESTGEVVVADKGAVISSGSLVNNGSIVNSGTITINTGSFTNNNIIDNNGSMMVGGDVQYSGSGGTIDNSKDMFLSDIVDEDGSSAVHEIFNTIKNGADATIFLTGEEAVIEELVLRDGSSGMVNTGTVTEFKKKVDVKDADLNISNGSYFGGDVSAKTIYTNADDTNRNNENTFENGTVKATVIIGAEGGTNNFYSNVEVTDAIYVYGTDNYGGTVLGNVNIDGEANFLAGSEYTGGIIANSGSGSLNFANGSALSDGSIINSGTITIGDMVKDQNAFNAITNKDGATITFTGTNPIENDLALEYGSRGSTVNTGSATEFRGLDAKDATLNITSESKFDGNVAAGVINTNGTNPEKKNIFNGDVSASTINGSVGGTNDFNGKVTVADIINVHGTDNYAGTVQGKMAVHSTGTANFLDNSNYIGNSIDNSGHVTLGDMVDNVSKSSVHNAFNSIMNNDGARITFTGVEAITDNLELKDGSSGIVDTNTVRSFNDIDVKKAQLVVTSEEGTVFHGDIVSKNNAADAILVNGAATFHQTVSGNMTVNAASRLEGTAAAFIGGDLTLGNTLTNNGGKVTIENGKTLSLDGDLIILNTTVDENVHRGRLTFEDGSIFVAGKGEIVNDGDILLGDMINIDGAFNSVLNNSGGVITFDGPTEVHNKLAVRDGSTGTVNTGTVVSFADDVNVKGGRLSIKNPEGYDAVFSGNVASANSADDAIHVQTAATFHKQVAGNLTADAKTVFVGSGSGFSSGNITVNAAVENQGGIIALNKGNFMVLNGANIDNTGSIRFDKESTFKKTPVGMLNNQDKGIITADVQMATLSDLVAQTSLKDGSDFNFTSTGNATLAENLAFSEIERGANVNFAANGGVLTLGQDYSFEKANIAFTSGTVLLADGISLAAGRLGSFNVASGSAMRYDGVGSNATIKAANSSINGDVIIASSTGKLTFDGNLTFNSGSRIYLTADKNGMGKIETVYSNNKVNIQSVTGIRIDGTAEDVLNAGELIIAGKKTPEITTLDINSDINEVSGVGNLQDIPSRYEYKLNEAGNVVVVAVKETPGVIEDIDNGSKGDGDDGSKGDNGGNDNGNKDGGDKNTGGLDNSTGSTIGDNKQNGGNYIDDLYGNVDADLERDFGNYIDNAIDRGGADGFNALGQLFGEYGANGSDGMVQANEVFFKTVYNHMNFGVVQQLVDGYAVLPGSTGALAQTAPTGATVRDANGICYRERIGSLWAGFLGGWSKQKSKDRISGYDYDTYGAILGYDRQMDRLHVGFAGAYQRGYLDVDDMATKFKSHFMNLGLYGSYILENSLYLKAGLGYAYGWNKYDVGMILGGRKHGSYNIQAYSANTEIGYAISLPANFKIIPSVGLRYTHLRQDAWTESLEGGNRNIANWFDKKKYNYVDIPLDVRLAKSFCTNGIVLTPEVHAGWTYAAKHEQPNVTTGFVGTDRGFTVFGVNPGRNRFIAGASFKGRFTNNFEASLDYNLETRSKYTDHSLSLSAVLTF